MFNVGIGEIAVIVLVCLIVFGPERLPQMARQLGRFLGQVRLTTQNALDQLKEEAELKDINLPDLRVGSLRSQARDYVRELLDIEGQMAELEREREEIKASLQAEVEPNGSAEHRSGVDGSADYDTASVDGSADQDAASVDGSVGDVFIADGSVEDMTASVDGSVEPLPAADGSAPPEAAAAKPAPVDPEAT